MNIIEPKEFHLLIEEIVAEKKCGYVEAVMIYQEKSNVEVETLAALIKQAPVLKAKMQEEAEAVKTVKRSRRLKFT